MGSLPVGISGSRAAAILGLSQYSTPFTVWQEIQEKLKPGFNAERGYIYEEFTGNAATEFGLAFEDAVINLTQQATGHTITHREAAYSLTTIKKGTAVGPTTFIDEQPYVTCHIDGILGKNVLFEGKTTNHRAFGFSWGEPGTDRVPVSVQCQAQHNMMCAGLESAHVSVLVFPSTVNEWEELGWKAKEYGIDGLYGLFLNNKFVCTPEDWAGPLSDMGFFHTYHIEAKPDTQKILKELYEEFWNKYILEEIAPDAVDYSDIKKMFTAPKGVLVVDEKQAELMREYKDITKEIGSSGHLAKRKTFIRTGILKHVMANTTVADEDAVEKVVIMDQSGQKLGSYNGKSYRS